VWNEHTELLSVVTWNYRKIAMSCCHLICGCNKCHSTSLSTGWTVAAPELFERLAEPYLQTNHLSTVSLCPLHIVKWLRRLSTVWNRSSHVGQCAQKRWNVFLTTRHRAVQIKSQRWGCSWWFTRDDTTSDDGTTQWMTNTVYNVHRQVVLMVEVWCRPH